jgi:hypothetical protein
MKNQLSCFARLAHAVAQPRCSRASEQVRLSRPYRPSSMFAALLVKEHLRLNYHGLEDLLRLSGQLRRWHCHGNCADPH